MHRFYPSKSVCPRVNFSLNIHEFVRKYIWSIIYSHSNSYRYACGYIIIIITIFKDTDADQIEDKAMPENWTGLEIPNWGLAGQSLIVANDVLVPNK